MTYKINSDPDKEPMPMGALLNASFVMTLIDRVVEAEKKISVLEMKNENQSDMIKELWNAHLKWAILDEEASQTSRYLYGSENTWAEFGITKEYAEAFLLEHIKERYGTTH
jgi:hypothetical protein